MRLELDVPDSHVLLSDFDAWHCVLNRWLHSGSEAEHDAFERDLAATGITTGDWPLPEPFHSMILRSWLRIFELDFAGDVAWIGAKDSQAIQATFWRLDRSVVRRVDFFTAR